MSREPLNARVSSDDEHVALTSDAENGRSHFGTWRAPACADQGHSQAMPHAFADKHPAFLTLLRHHAFDWVGGVLAVVAGFAVGRINPNERSFFPTDDSISYAWKDDTYPAWALAFPLPVFPLVLFILVSGLVRKRWDEVHRATLGLLVAGGMTLLVTNVLKVSVGRLRPGFIDACLPDPALVSLALSAPPGSARSLPPSSCTGPASRIINARQSFPSGHTSYSFAGLGMVGAYVWERVSFGKRRRGKRGAWFDGELRERGRRVSLIAFEILGVLVPVMGAALVGISRIEDNKHHWSDVFAGALIGSLSALVAWVYFVREPVKRRD
ncbi:acid phosphatase/Vanadium-dependent haloperoxidase [Gonapodya prolifera JEL478]|uniref:Acid phosphatase/Vanadium-dependent haloperoxidase n=1 Tax=Gonapodya prolifera (strain JEL478) TaxID=1344416 RepID=A0A139A4B2_GONPJ|nr:acid phosphatase/Vanadium-dependent haloperoxidase [Gonapodya prolifera JEL478]|eukprot:KXS11554.1 acid phosphatase/Vanadium-dependent haloperoxidase [Gonapodya prolifera JEL478]